MQTQVHVGVMWPSQSSELWCTISESPDRRCGEVSIVGEPLEATCRSRDGRFSRNCREPIAVRPRTARERPGLITNSGNGQWEARSEGDDRTDRPASNDLVHYLVVAIKFLSLSKRELINRISGQNVGSIVIAWRPFRFGIVDVLPICGCTQGIVPSSVVTRAIRH